jgi:phospholipase/carboxylesterase
MEQLNRAMMQGQRVSLRNENPPQLAEVRGMLTNFLDEVLRDSGLTLPSFVLGGFSQGAMLTADVTLRLPSAPAALCLFSGTLLCEQEWRPLARQRGPLRVFQSHGRQDVLLSFEAAEILRDMLIEGGMDVEFIPFNGPHTIPMEAVEGFADMLEEIVNKS